MWATQVPIIAPFTAKTRNVASRGLKSALSPGRDSACAARALRHNCTTARPTFTSDGTSIPLATGAVAASPGPARVGVPGECREDSAGRVRERGSLGDVARRGRRGAGGRPRGSIDPGDPATAPRPYRRGARRGPERAAGRRRCSAPASGCSTGPGRRGSGSSRSAAEPGTRASRPTSPRPRRSGRRRRRGRGVGLSRGHRSQRARRASSSARVTRAPATPSLSRSRAGRRGAARLYAAAEGSPSGGSPGSIGRPRWERGRAKLRTWPHWAPTKCCTSVGADAWSCG